jgi:hypothetical protein
MLMGGTWCVVLARLTEYERRHGPLFSVCVILVMCTVSLTLLVKRDYVQIDPGLKITVKITSEAIDTLNFDFVYRVNVRAVRLLIEETVVGKSYITTLVSLLNIVYKSWTCKL